MDISFQDQTWQIADTAAEVEILINRLGESLKEQNLHISHMEIDGAEIYGDYQAYIMQELPNIRYIHVNVVTIKQFADELIASSHDYCKNAAQQLPELSTQYYQTPSQETWQQFQSFLEGADWLIQMIGLIEDMAISYNNGAAFSEIGKSFGHIISELLEAMERRDHTAIGDLLQYEVLPLIEKLQLELHRTMKEEGVLG